MNDRDATADWLLSTHGRIARIVAGSLLIIIGLGIIGGFLGVLLLILGAIPIASAAYGTLLIGPLLGRDIRGRRPEDQPAQEKEDADEEDDGEDDGEDDDEPRDEDEPDTDWSAPPARPCGAAGGPGPAHEGPARGRAGRGRPAPIAR